MRNTTKTSASLTDPATESTDRHRARGSFLLRSLALPVAAVMGAGTFMLHAPGVAVADPSTPGASETPSPVATGSASSAEKEQVLSAAQNLVDGGYPAALTAVRDKDGNTIGAAAGTGNLETGEAPPLDGEVRIGSNTKTFVAVVILQLVQEGKITLDEPIETYLPGLLHGEGIDGAKITVRQLLQHTSGLPEYTDTVPGETDIFQIRDNYYSTRDLLDVALSKPAAFEPGSQFRYTNTNYIVLTLLAEKVTHRPLAEQITQRITEPLGLAHTYYPNPGEEEIRGTHPHGYHRNTPTENWQDITRMDPSWAGGAGAMISTPSELTTFIQATFDGTLLTQDSINEMKKTVDTSNLSGVPGSGYGLGIFSMPLSCGTAWGHSGGIPGYTTQNMVGPDGTAVTIAGTAPLQAIVDPSDTAAVQQKAKLMPDAVDSLLCKRQG